MRKTDICPGVSCVEIPEARFSVLCGCPENVVKLLIKAGFIRPAEREGVAFETGPNAILLSETPIQGGRFCNLGEFPVLQMLYRQGMLIPRHPNNSGLKPMIIGLREQVEAQARYIHLGNYGLSSVQELEAAGLSREAAGEQRRMKLKFAFGAIRGSEEILDLRIIDGHALALRDGVFIRRVAANRYEFIHDGASTEVDLGLPPGKRYAAPYELPRVPPADEAFAILHIGEGDGWDIDRPCMGSLVIHRGRPYLIDAGPNIEESLEAVGIEVRELGGIFQTHAHDDHFVGLTALLGSDRRIPFYSVPCVRHTVERKLGALCAIGERDFGRFFEVRDLAEGVWNDVEGLEVMPLLAPHPVENTIMRFRAAEGGSWRSYAHLADLASFSVLDSMVSADPAAPGISRERAERAKRAYLEPADLKKIDAGGGMIHGEASDFAGDESGRVLASHTDSEAAARGTGLAVAAFGELSVLIRGKGARRPGAGASRETEGGRRSALERSPLFEGKVSGERLRAIASLARAVRYRDGCAVAAEEGPALFFLGAGRVMVRSGGKPFASLGPGDFFGEERLLYEPSCLFEAFAAGEASGLLLPASAVMDCPVVLWRLREEHERRLAALKARFEFAWRAEYAVGEAEVDSQHRRLFAIIGSLAADYGERGDCADAPARFRELIDFAAGHFATEEGLMRSWGYPGLTDHELEHQALMKDAGRYLALVECGDAAAAEGLVDFLKGWLLKHTLLTDRQFIPWIGKEGRGA